MREPVDRDRVLALLDVLGRAARTEVRAYLVGGTTMVVEGLRESTIDVDLRLEPDDDDVLRAIARAKDRLSINVELASPEDFIPVPPGQADRATYVRRDGRLTTYHYDLYAQALAKVERGHRQDVEDVERLLAAGLVQAPHALAYFERLAPDLFRYPALDAAAFRAAVQRTFGG